MKLTAGALLLMLLLQAGFGQVGVSLSHAPRKSAQRMLNSRVAQVVSVWVVTLENNSAIEVALTESAVLRKIPHLTPFDHEALSLLIEEGAKYSKLAVAGRVLGEDLPRVGTFLAASEQIKVSQPMLAALTGFTAFAPYLRDRIRGVEKPVLASFERLAWRQPLRLVPGQTATAHIFTAVWPDGTKAQEFVIDVSRVPAIRLVQ